MAVCHRNQSMTSKNKMDKIDIADVYKENELSTHTSTSSRKRSVSNRNPGNIQKRRRVHSKKFASSEGQEAAGHNSITQIEYFEPDAVRLLNKNDLNRLIQKWETGSHNNNEDDSDAYSEDHEWNTHCAALICYGDKYATCNIYQKLKCHLPDGKVLNLGNWLATQRTLKKNLQLREDRFQRLQELVDSKVLNWDPQTDNDKWDIMFNYLLEYGEKHNGNCNVRYRHSLTQSDGTEVMLGIWLSNQRMRYKAGKLHQDRIDRLQVLVDQNKLLWNAVDKMGCTPDSDRWTAMYNHLLKYGEQHDGDCNVPNKSCVVTLGDNMKINLGKWLNNQRTKYKSGNLPQDRVDKLQALVDQNKLLWNAIEKKGFLPDDEKWNEMFNHLVKYGENNNRNCNVPQNYAFVLPDSDGNEIKLGQWLSTQRQNYKAGCLAKERLDRLQVLVDQDKLLWDASEMMGERPPLDDKWTAYFLLLLAYGEEHGNNCNVPQNYLITKNDNTQFKLGRWLQNQRTFHRLGKLSKYRDDMLQELVNTNALRW